MFSFSDVQKHWLVRHAVLLCMVFMCLLVLLSVVDCKFLKIQNYVFNFKRFEQVSTIYWVIGKW